MFKTTSIASAVLLSALVSTGASAIRLSETFEVSVTIPSAAFYVIPAETDWLHRDQRLPWNPVTQDLSPLRKAFDVKNDSGAITARLSFEPFLSNGKDTDSIPLVVTFNHKRLGLTAEEVISALDGKAGQRVNLEIVPVKPVDGFKPGDYHGSVHMVFEALAP